MEGEGGDTNRRRCCWQWDILVIQTEIYVRCPDGTQLFHIVKILLRNSVLCEQAFIQIGEHSESTASHSRIVQLIEQ